MLSTLRFSNEPFLITRKATIGFILLALLVFPTAYLSWQPPMIKVAASDVNLGDYKPMDKSVRETATYHPADISFDSPLVMAVVVTAILELFTMACYLVLKRVEPYVVAWEQSERERVRNS
jgi:hypothetical protein